MTGSLGVYVHWPFCVTKCPYCDFNSHVRERVDQEAWRTALLTDLAHEAALTPGRTVASVFFGGGTPSLMPPATVAALIEAVARHWQVAADLEITVEANPSSVEAARFADLAAAGVNRLSLGLQALDDPTLRFLGRPHTLREGLAALETAQAHFVRVSFDLIYARPGQSPDDWRRELGQALGFGATHLSLYQLTIEPLTRFAELHRRGDLDMPDEETALALWQVTQEMTRAAGLLRYEVSNHARPGHESRHNLGYWRSADYVGVGPGAHGRRGLCATTRLRKPEAWLDAVTRHGHGLEPESALTAGERAVEALMMGLRLTEGVDLQHLTNGIDEGAAHDLIDVQALAELVSLGYAAQHGSAVRITDAGMPLLDAILPRLVR